MGEKSGGLTNMIIVLVALVVVIAFVNVMFPEVTETVTTKMKDIIDVNPADYEGNYS